MLNIIAGFTPRDTLEWSALFLWPVILLVGFLIVAKLLWYLHKKRPINLKVLLATILLLVLAPLSMNYAIQVTPDSIPPNECFNNAVSTPEYTGDCAHQKQIESGETYRAASYFLLLAATLTSFFIRKELPADKNSKRAKKQVSKSGYKPF